MLLMTSHAPMEYFVICPFLDNVFHTSCTEILRMEPDKLKKNISVKFDGEEGLVSGICCLTKASYDVDSTNVY